MIWNWVMCIELKNIRRWTVKSNQIYWSESIQWYEINNIVVCSIKIAINSTFDIL